MNKLSLTEDEVKSATVPRLAVIGEVDPLKAGVDELKEEAPDVKVVVIEKGDHMTTFGSPEFLEAITAFLAENSLQAAAAAGK
jgi:pimeloyl-ACP methyl ester carboxylesterase